VHAKIKIRLQNIEKYKRRFHAMNVGLIGCGWAANVHLQAYQRIKDVKVVAVSDINFHKAKTFADRYKIPKIFSNYIDLLESKNLNLDLVDICTPTSTHAEIACNVAKYGYDILLEKPMARTSALCDQIISEVSKRNVRLCVCHNRLFNPAVKEAKSSGDYKLVKTVYRTHVTSHWSQKPEEGGMLWENGTHCAYIQNYFLGNVEEVWAVGDKIGNPTYYKIFSLLKSKDEVVGVMELSWVSDHYEDMLELYKFDRSVKIDLSYFPKRFFDIYNYDYSVSQILKEAVKALYNRATFMLSASTPRTFHFELIKKYIDSLKSNEEPPVKPTEGRAAIRLLECIEKSIETGKWVRFNASQ